MNRAHFSMKSCAVVAAFFLALAPANLFAQSGNLTLEKMSGDVQIMPAGRSVWVTPSGGELLFEGDYIRTGKKALAVLRLEQYGTFTLSGKTEVKINKKEIRKKIVETEFKLVVGTVKGDIEGLPKGSSMKVRTSTSVLAVRGTSFLVALSIAGIVTSYVRSGSLFIQVVGTGATSTLGSGQAAQVTSTGITNVDPGSAAFSAVASAFDQISSQAAALAPAAPALAGGEGDAEGDQPPPSEEGDATDGDEPPPADDAMLADAPPVTGVDPAGVLGTETAAADAAAASTSS